MNKHAKFLNRLMSGLSDNNIDFFDLCLLLKYIGFQERIRGDHHIFTKDGITEIINLQPVNNKAKPYQVKQVRNLLHTYNLDETIK